ncbi:MAG: mechanosensitive ion channel [Anaerolineae bacterium]|nr:mechanosensitive ion channel [Gloeobacterales cyanobacterium ES-bin-313]
MSPLDNIFNFTLFRLGNQSFTLLWLVRLVLALLILIIVVNLFKRLLRERVLVRLGISQGNREAISTLVSYGLGGLIFIVLLQLYGLDITSLAVLAGGLGVGIGFGLQELVKNLFSGLTLLLEGKLQVGDFVEFNDLSGYIKEISIRSTIVSTFDGGDVVVPNSDLTSNQVLNWNYKNYTGKIRLPVGVAYDTDPLLVVETLLNSAYMQPDVMHDPPPKVIFKNFGDSALNFELWVWINRIDQGINVRSSLNFIINYNCRQAGIKMPFPQRDLWVRNAETLSPQSIQKESTQTIHSQSTAETPIPHSTMASPPTQSTSLRELLRQVPYFQTCLDLNLLQIVEAGYRKMLTTSEIIFNEGEMGHSVYFLLSGSVESFSIKLSQQIKVYQVGDLFGEVPVMLEIPYIVSSRALEEAILFVIPKKNLENLLRSNPYLADVLAQAMTSEKEFYAPVRQQLQDLGLLDMNKDSYDLVNWVRSRLKKLFA